MNDCRKEEWDDYFLKMTDLVAEKSKDPSTKCGAVIVGDDNTVKGCGYNGFPRSVEYQQPIPSTENRLEKPTKYKFMCHAELNAILNCGRNGVPLLGSRIYINAPPCTECAKAIIQSGIKEVITKKNHPFVNRKDWEESFEFGRQMLNEACVNIVYREI